jgi:hypothetical protein
MVEEEMKFILFFIFFIISLSAIAKSERKLFLVFIKPNSTLVDLQTDQVFSNQKGFYANVLERNTERRDQFYVYNKSGKAEFLIDSHDIVDIENDIKLLTEERGNVIFPPPTQFKTTNKIFSFESEFNFNLDQVDLSSLNEFLQSDVNNITASRFKINTHLISVLPINAGINLNYQTSSWHDQNKINSRISILSTGPEFKFRMIERDTYRMSALISYEFCPIYSINSDQGTDKFSAFLWDLGLQNVVDTKLGNFNFGLDFRKHYLTFKNSTRAIPTIYSNEYSVTSLGISIGYKLDWEL